MDLSQLGSLLREERERRGLSIEQVSDAIKITRTCITAIEEGKEECLPHPVYAKGFIKNYAKLLELDNETFLEQLSKIYQSEETAAREAPLNRNMDEGACGCSGGAGLGGRPLLPLLVAGVVVALVIAGGIWYFFRSAPQSLAPEPAATSQAPAAEPEPESPAPAQPAATPAPMPSVPVTPAPAPESSQAAATATTPPEPAAPAMTPPAPTQEEQPTSEPAATAEDKATQAIAMSGPQADASAPMEAPSPAPTGRQFFVGDRGNHRVVITATDRCWLQAGADGGTMHETMLEAGDSFLGRFADYLLVRLGNAGAVKIQFDDKPYPLHALKGSVKTLKFVSQNNEQAVPPLEGTTSAASPAQPQAGESPAKTGHPTATMAPAATTATTATTDTPAAKGDKELEVYGQDGSWVVLIPDGGPSKEVYVKKGQRLTVPFHGKIAVKLGNPSNVIFRYDGKETPVTTQRGQFRTVHFP